MDASAITSVATITVAILSPYLKLAAEGFSQNVGKELGREAVAKSAKLCGRVKSALTDSSGNDEALEQVKASPDSEEAKQALMKEIEQSLRQEDGLADELSALIKEIDSAGFDSIFKTSIHGDVEKFLQINVVQGDVNL